MAWKEYAQELQMIDPETIPHSWLVSTCAVATVVVRTLSYIFLRWIPSPWMQQIITPLVTLYIPAFLALVLSKPLFTTKSETSEIKTIPHHDEHAVDEDSSTHSNGSVTVEATRVKIMTRKKTAPWKTLFLGIPSLMDNPKLTALTLLLNLAAYTMVYDDTYRLPKYYKSEDLSFARVGYVSDTSANLLVREPASSDYVKFNPVYVVSYREENATESDSLLKNLFVWHTKEFEAFTEAHDYTASAQLTGLKPSHTYRYLTTGNHTGTFTTAPKKGAKGKYTFLTTSCIKQRVPYNPFRNPLDIPGLKHLARVLPDVKAQFMLFLGDFIYVDVPTRPGKDVESYRMMYRQIYSSKDWPAVSTDLPWVHVLDDHEIANDWDQGEEGLYKAAIDPYKSYQHAVNPPAVRSNSTYYTFNWGPSSFFLLDTRRYRSANSLEDSPEKTMLGANQLHDLLHWLKKEDKDIQWKFIVTSVPFTKNWQVNGDDTWRGFQWERSKILEAAWAVKGAGVVILSGDRHEFAATSFPPPLYSGFPPSSTVYEFSCSPLSQFYLPIRTYKQTDDKDVLIKYIPDGNSKFGAIEIDSTSAEQAVLKYKLFVDGKEAWNWVLTAPIKVSPGERGKLGRRS